MVVILRGCERSGTNYLKKLIEYNFDVMVRWKQEKHSPKIRNKEALPVVFVTKNPYSWLVSYYNFRSLYRKGPKKAEVFKREHPIHRILKDRSMLRPINGIRKYEGAIDSYNHRNWAWANAGAFHTRYEDLLADFEGTMDRMGEWLGIKGVSGTLSNVVRDVGFFQTRNDKNKIVFMPSSECTNDWPKLRYYLDEEYMREYDVKLLNTVNSQLDWGLMSRLGYVRKNVLK